MNTVSFLFLLFIALPALIGLGGTLALALGFIDLGPVPGLPPRLWISALLSLWTGLASTLLAATLAFAILARFGAAAARWLSPLAAVPHAALGLALAFLIAPSGWITRVLGFARPPDIALLHDPLGIGLIFGLALKELAFLLIVAAAALPRISLPVGTTLKAARSLGRPDAETWALVLLPMLWPLVRLPVLIVLAYSLTVVDMALILGPANPPTLAVVTIRLATAPELGALVPAAQLALGQLALVGIGALILLGIARATRWLVESALLSGRRRATAPLLPTGRLALSGAVGVGVVAASALIVWSVARRWAFPDLWPDGLTLRAWTSVSGVWPAATTTLLLGLASSAIALALSIALLEARDRRGGPPLPVLVSLSALPLLLPQVAFLFGLQVVLLRLGAPPGFWTVLAAHLTLVVPYALICLAEPWAALDPQLVRQAASLGRGPWYRLFRVKLPVLATPLLTVFAIGFSVSVAQYLTTLTVGAGRVATLTTEAVALSSGSDRRLSAAMGLMQAVLPLAGFGLALILPRVLWRNRKGMLA